MQVGGEDDLEGPAGLTATTSDGRRPTGRVVGIIRRNWRTRCAIPCWAVCTCTQLAHANWHTLTAAVSTRATPTNSHTVLTSTMLPPRSGYCGSLKPQELPSGSSTAALLFVPVDRRIPMIRCDASCSCWLHHHPSMTDIYEHDGVCLLMLTWPPAPAPAPPPGTCCSIHTRQGSALMDKRLVVAIDGWDMDSTYPSGHYVRTLGKIGEREVETVRFAFAHDVPPQ